MTPTPPKQLQTHISASAQSKQHGFFPAIQSDPSSLHSASPKNIENASYTPTVCAERTAFFKAITEGKREFSAIAICGGKDGVIEGFFPPCGVCRQVMREFCRDDFLVHMVGKGEIKTRTLAQLLPDSFSL